MLKWSGASGQVRKQSSFLYMVIWVIVWGCWVFANQLIEEGGLDLLQLNVNVNCELTLYNTTYLTELRESMLFCLHQMNSAWRCDDTRIVTSKIPTTVDTHWKCLVASVYVKAIDDCWWRMRVLKGRSSTTTPTAVVKKWVPDDQCYSPQL